ncbi:MAG: 2,3-diphosphoglycerate synthetase, partial [Candidatus Methanosuratus sp.]|nr:2,3-diphosphoglycerate synthetase [Candidatus Methanosuratincola sp.]
PAVTKSALEELDREHDVVCAVFLGGTEKIGSDKDLAVLGVPIVKDADYLAAISRAVKEYTPDQVIDLSDEPVLGYRERFAIASLVLAHGVVYSGADFEFRPPKQNVTLKKASISVVGTGKRIGKTAIGGYVARVLAKEFKPIVVTMGRGGPAEPELIPGTELNINPEYLLSVSRQGKHASSDHYEDTLTSRVTTIGSRRYGGGMSGQTYFSNVDRAARLSEQTDENIVVFEGSGCTIPSVRTDAQILVVGAHQPLDYITSYLGPYRVRTSDIIIITMCEPPMAEDSQVKAMYDTVKALNPDAFVARTVFRPRPLEDLSGKRVAVCLTASKKMAGTIA